MRDVSPELLIDGVRAFHVTAALKAAIELDLFSKIAEGAHTGTDLAQRVGASEHGVRILSDFLTIRGFLEKTDGSYRLTPSSAAFLDRRSPTYMGSIIDFLASRERLEEALLDPAATVRRGGAAGEGSIAPENPIWVKFARVMGPFMAPVAAQIAAHVAVFPRPPRRVLDIAAGHGLFGILVAKQVPGAEITAVDWAAVLDEARTNAERMGVAERFHMVPGSAFDADWGTGFDLVLLPNFLHHFNPETCVGLLRKIRKSLAPEGRVLASEFVPNQDRITPPQVARFSFEMLLSTREGDAYTEAEYAAMARDAGFRGVSTGPLPPTPQSLVEFLH